MASLPAAVPAASPLSLWRSRQASSGRAWPERSDHRSSRIELWWNEWSDANVGLVTGVDFDVLDVDQRHGGDDSLAELELVHGPLPITVEQITGNGRHLLFLPTVGLRNSVQKLGAGIDVRSRGGYVVAAPSLHATGRRYAWNVDRHPLNHSIAAAPPWLIARARRDTSKANSFKAATPPAEWQTLLAQPCAEGARNTTLARLTGHLLRHGVDPYAVHELVVAWNVTHCIPPLDPDEVSRTVNSITAAEVRRRENVRGR